MSAPSVAIVTGGGSGIGAAMARAFAEEGRRVVIVGRRRNMLAEVANEIRGKAGEVHEIVADLAEPSAASHVVASTLEAFGQIDVLVNNAAIIKIGPLEGVTIADFESHIAVNLRAPFLLTQAALPSLRRSEAASILNISSCAGTVVRPMESLYGLTKAALDYFTKSLAAELAPERIRVNGIVPGPVNTAIHASYGATREASLMRLLPQIPLGRIGEPEEIARWATRLCNSDAGWVTGVLLPVDGGSTLDFR